MVYRCAVIGCGRIGCGFDDNSKLIRTHTGAYYANTNTVLNALCDIDKKKLKKYGKKYQVQNLYTDYNEMLKKEKLDIISVCTLVDTHYNIVRSAVNNSVKGIFLEKPIADTLYNAKKMITLCHKNNVKLLIDYQRRFIPLYYKIQEYVLFKKLGHIQNVIVYYGGGIANTGTHIFDLLYFLFGDVKRINANLSSNSSHNTNDPNLDVKLIFNNNISCSLLALDTTNYGILEMDIFGTDGRLRVDMASHTVNYHVISKKKSKVYKHLRQKKFPKTKNPKEPIVLGLKNLIESIRTKKLSICSGNDGYKSLELVVASLMSIKKKKPIVLPIKSSYYTINSK